MARSAGRTAVHRPHEQAPAVLAENRRRYERLVEMVRRFADQGDVEHVLRAAMLAADYAWLAPVGLLSDVRLERAVVHAVRGSEPVRVDGDRRAGRVLHVMSQAYAVGGHTRLVSRWVSRDERSSDVVLTNQAGAVPDALLESVRARGGEVHELRTANPALLDRAHALRRHMDRADLVVLHVHPYDSVALAAVNLPGARPPVVYENHTDQSFWLGVAGADLLCDLRPQARPLDLALRGVAEERIAVLPMPVDELPSAEGEALRRRLGIAPDAVVALTVSADWKLAACWGRGMHHAVERVLHWAPQVSVVLVGATPNEDWTRLGKRYPGRVFPVGTVLDPAPYFALADIYLDSYPVRSPTATLEAAVLGLPIATLEDLAEEELASILQAGSPGVDGRPVTTTADKFAVAVRRLALDPDRRRREGEEVRAAVLALHDGPAWRSGLEALYARARSLPPVDVDELADSACDERFGAMILSAMSPMRSANPHLVGEHLLAELFDDALQTSLFAALQRDAGSSLGLRVAAGWEHHAAWTTRLLALAGAYPRLRVSLPFVAGDDVAGSSTGALLLDLLRGLGQTPEGCGDLNVESAAPHDVVPSVSELPFSSEALDWLALLLASPCWVEAAPVAGERASSHPVLV